MFIIGKNKITRNDFDPKNLHHDETVFTIGNGYLCTRGTFEEGYPNENVATFAHGVFNDVPVVFTELVNLPNWTAITISLDGEVFRMDQGTVVSFQRTLDMETALLTRVVEWQSPSGKRYRFHFERFTCLDNQHILMVRLGVEPLEFDAELNIQAGLNGFADNLGFQHWDFVSQSQDNGIGALTLKTKQTNLKLGMAFSMTDQSGQADFDLWMIPQYPVFNAAKVQLAVGKTHWFEKRVAVYTSRDNDDPTAAAVNTLRENEKRQWHSLFNNHTEAWKKVWDTSLIEIDSEDDMEGIVQYNLYQLLIASPWRDEQVNIGAKTLSGYGYRGHAFWDTEIFMHPFFTYTQPQVARNLLSYRYHRLAGARKKAAANGYMGAQFPWESADTGDEVTPTWVPDARDRKNLIRIWTGDIQIHVSADIALAIWRYWQLTGDQIFFVERGLPIIVETALFWESRLEWSEEDQDFQITDVIGPDEYHDHVDNNAYTNFIARWHLNLAADLFSQFKDKAKALFQSFDIDETTISKWQAMASKIRIKMDENSGLIEQFDGFFDLDEVDWAGLEPRTESIQGVFGIERTNQLKALKQADVLMLMYLFPEYFDEKTVRVNYEYYNTRTDHTYGSSLGPSIHALIACRLGLVKDAYEHFLRTAHADIYDVRGNAGDGIHAASAGGLWQTVVFGFAGLKIKGNTYTVEPNLPSQWNSLKFRFFLKGELKEVEIKSEE